MRGTPLTTTQGTQRCGGCSAAVRARASCCNFWPSSPTNRFFFSRCSRQGAARVAAQRTRARATHVLVVTPLCNQLRALQALLLARQGKLCGGGFYERSAA